MFKVFAHAGHVHPSASLESMSAIDYRTSIIVGVGIVATILVATVIYFIIVRRQKK
ncbi:MAG: hypothetical protein ABWX90_01165 [Candidatus Saccharimonadales bacterium]